MKESKPIFDYFSRALAFVDLLKRIGESLNELLWLNIYIYINSKFDYIVIAIGQLMRSLQTHEERLKRKNQEN